MEMDANWLRQFIITFSIWLCLGVGILFTRSRTALLAWGIGPLTLLSIWGLHLFLGFPGGWWYPSTIEVFAAAFTWGIIFAIALMIFISIESKLYDRSKLTLSIPIRRMKAMAGGHFVVALVANFFPLQLGFGVLTFFDLPLFSILACMRPGMGGVTFLPHSVAFFYPCVGTLLYAVLGWMVGWIEVKLFRPKHCLPAKEIFSRER